MNLFFLVFLSKNSKSCKAWLTHNLQCLGVNVCCIQETQLSTHDDEYILSKRFVLYSVYSDESLRGVSWLVMAVCALFFADLVGKLFMLNVTIKDKPLCLIGLSAPNDHAEWPDLF